MYLLDTDHSSILQRGGEVAQRLLTRLANARKSEIAATLVSYEEQTRGWLSYIAKVGSIDAQVAAYSQLRKHLENYCAIPVLDFDESSICGVSTPQEDILSPWLNGFENRCDRHNQQRHTINP